MAIEMKLTETFHAPPDAVFAKLLDIDSFAEWMPGLVRIERKNDVNGKGMQFVETRKVFGREASEHFEVTAIEEGRMLELFVDGTKGTSKKGIYRFRYELAPTSAGTQMTLHGHIDGMGLAGAILGKLFAGAFKKAIAKDHAALKAHIERR